MGIKNAFKKIWLGIKVAEPYMMMAGKLLPPPFGTILSALDAVINAAEAKFPNEGSGVQKAEFFTEQGLKVAEILTGKNVDNPKTRALVGLIGDTAVEIKNIEARLVQLRDKYAEVVKQFKDAVDSVKEPAIEGDAPEPEVSPTEG